MKLSGEQLKQLQEKLAAEKDPAEAAKAAKEYGIDVSAEDMEKILDQVSGGVQALSDDAIEKVSGGVGGLTDLQYSVIKQAYMQKGPNEAFITCVYLIPSTVCYEVVALIEDELGIFA